MRHAPVTLTLSLVVLLSPTVLLAQAPRQSQSTSMSVPRLIRLTGTFRPADGQTPLSVETVTVAIYAEETGGTPLWQETQKLAIDPEGRYALLLGAGQPDGVPQDVFASGEPRWMGMVWNRPGEIESARWRATSVPYALRAGDAETLGGKPAAAYALASPADGRETTTTRDGAPIEGLVVPAAVNPGETNHLAKYVNGVDVGSSNVYETAGLVGINTTAPLDALHSRFTNTTGSMTGIAVQNLGSTATSYSGMLFYDHTGALGQFQGFNNSTKEYRINNIAAGGSINFMQNSISRFNIESGGNIGIGIENPTQKLEVIGAIWANTGDLRVLGTQSDGVRWVDASGSIQAHMHRFGSIDNRLYVTNNGSGNLTGVYLASGATTWTSTSDERLKTDIAPVTGILDKIKNIRVVGFNMASMAVDPKTGKPVVNRDIKARTMRNGRVIKHQIGSIAQDWLTNFPELVVEPKTDSDFYGLDYDRIGVVALGGVKELTNLLTEQDAEIQALKARLAALEQMLQQLKAEIEKQRQSKQQ